MYAAEWNKYTDNLLEINNYLLFPLQVFDDSQVKLHSSVSIEEALSIVVEKARMMNLILVVKPHPAESNWIALEK